MKLKVVKYIFVAIIFTGFIILYFLLPKLENAQHQPKCFTQCKTGTVCMNSPFLWTSILNVTCVPIPVRACKQIRLCSRYFANEPTLFCEQILTYFDELTIFCEWNRILNSRYSANDDELQLIKMSTIKSLLAKQRAIQIKRLMIDFIDCFLGSIQAVTC